MHAFVLTLGQDDPATALGALAAAVVDRPGGGHVLRKGQTIGAADVTALAWLAAETPGLRVSLLRPGAEDVDEIAAAQMLGAALAGPGVAARDPAQGRARLVATDGGLFQVDGARLARANRIADISIYTLFSETPVAAGTTLAEAKVTPLVAPRAAVAQAVAILHAAGEPPVLAVRPFVPRRAGLLVRERLDAEATARVVESLRRKLAWFGSTLEPADVVRTAGDQAEVAARLDALLAGGVDLLLTAGGSTSDPADAVLEALRPIGARLLRRGVPIHPGSLLWIASRGPALLAGVPSCGSFAEQTSLDLVLPRLLALGVAGLDGIERLAEGGLLTRGMEHRFPAYDRPAAG